MADFEKSPTKSKKRKTGSSKEKQKSSKTRRFDHSQNEREAKEVAREEDAEAEQRESNSKIEEGSPWRNLQLILSIRDKEVDTEAKVQIAYDFVKSRKSKEGDDTMQGFEAVSISRLIVFLSDWVQSLLIPLDKKNTVKEERSQSEVIGLCLDFRCWEIFSFCLEASVKLHVSLKFSRNLLRAIGGLARNALSLLGDLSLNSNGSLFTGKGFELYSVVPNCVLLVFSSHGGLLNDSLDSWISTVSAVLELVKKIDDNNLNSDNVGTFVLRFSCLVLEPFSKFLRVHPCRKNGFRDFIDKLLEPLLHVLGILHLLRDGSNLEWSRKLINLAEEVLSEGLLHHVHIDGFLSLQSTEKYARSVCGQSKGSKTIIKSYHRHLFDKLEKISAAKKVSVSGCLGELLRLLLRQVKKQKGKTGDSRHFEDDFSNPMSKMSSVNSIVISEKSYSASSLSAEMRKSLFDFFVQTMEPLLLEINNYYQGPLEMGPVLLDVHCILRSTNSVLSILMQENIYVRTEDTTDGACLNFLQKVYDIIESFSAKLIQFCQPMCGKDWGPHVEILYLIAEELIVSVGCFVKIEYEVFGNDLIKLWLMLLSFLALGLCMVDAPGQCSISLKIVDLGCQLINLYRDLRQVNNIIIALCKAVRICVSSDGYGGMNSSEYVPYTSSLSYEASAKSAKMLICSQEFRLVIHKAVKFIPEGQASGCIRQIAMDISESLEWLKACFSGAAKRGSERVSLRRCSKTSLDLQLEVLGRCLSEMSILVLDSLTVTMGNSTLVASSMKDLMAVIHPCMSNLVGLHQDGVSEFLFSVTGMTSIDKLDGSKNDLLRLGGLTHWAFLFFFRLYLSFRSLYREAISLLPTNSSKTKSAVMEDLIMANSGRDWLKNTDWTDQGYFSCIVHPSASLLLVIQSISDVHFQENVAYCSPLVCVLHAMALQRLVDLNRQIKSFEYLLRRDENLVQVELINEADLSLNHQSRKWERWISDLRQEAAGLTEYIMGFLSLVAEKQQSTNSLDDAACKDIYPQALNENDTWDLGVCDVNEKSLPTAIWWIICQNIDTWCAHAAKKKLKMFLSLLIQSSLSCIEVGKRNISKSNRLRVTVQQISLELLSDTILYEQRCVRRYLAPRFCHILGKSMSSLFRGSSYDLSLLPDWSEFLNALGKSSMVVSSDVNVTYDCSSTVPPSSQFSNSACSLTSMDFTACSNLLNLLCWMPKDYLNSKSFPRFASSILNLERLVVGNILDCHDAFDVHHYQLFGLFATCRRALKCLIMASCDEMIEASESSLFPIFFQGFHALWLFKAVSLVVGLQHEFSEDSMSQIKVTIFSLMDHTSYVFMTLSKYQFRLAVHLLVTANKICEEKLNSGVSHEQIKSMEFDSCSDSSKDIDLWNGIILVAETLKEQIEILFTALKDTSRSGKVEVTNLNKLSTLVSCAQGFLWGLASAISDIDAKDFDGKSNLLKWIQVPISKINLFISVFTDFINHILCTVFVKNDQWPKGLCDAQNLLKFDHCKDSSSLGETAASISCPEGNTSCGKSQVKSEAARSGLASSNVDDEPENSSIPKKRLQSSNADCDASVLTMVDLPELLCLNNPFLRSFLDGTNPEAAYLLRQLFIASSAILRFNLQINCTPFRSSSVPIFIGISQVLLLELANRVEVPPPLSIACLDGVMKYLEELGNQLPLTTPTLTRNIYAKLMDLHLRAIGKCISLQGKKATLASHETKSSTKTLDGHGGLSEASFSHEPYHLDELKSRLRMSFRTFISKPSELHLLTAIQALERALVGVQGGYTMIYKVSTGSRDGGKVSTVVAAGVDCLDQVLEFASGRKRLNLVKRHIQTLIAGLFNIFLHLQSPLVFYEKLVGSKGDDDPDPGSVILMCIEVLTKISGKHALFQMDTCHVAQSLRIPAALFEGFHMLRLSEASSPPSSLTLMNDLDYDPAASIDAFAMDRHFSINLYAACCQLLHTILKHHKSECEKCIALLEVSVSVLLQSLETEDTGLSVRKGYFAWEVQEGVRCASFLRRIYEEMRHQKDVFGRYCHKFLSSYIWIYSGYGPLKTGIRREIDEALRPGVYALIDVCSADDLQYLHTVFGEGPCRSILATLQHDYKVSFQYGGKV